MTKKIFLLIPAIWVALCLTQSCKHDTIPSCTHPTDSLSYNGNMQAIIIRDCARSGCHVAGGSGSGNYTTFAGIRPYLDDNTVYDEVVITHNMPEGFSLSDATIDSFNCWIQAGYPEN